MTYHFYILHSTTLNRYYIGHTSQLAERLRKHNSHHKGFTGKADDWLVVYDEIYETKVEAYAREREVKAWKNSKLLEALIQRSKGV